MSFPDLIENGWFASDDLSPWERCADNELGEAWVCLEDEEPDFPRTRWVYTREGGLTDHNPVFLSEYNLRMTENDGVVQHMRGRDARARGDLTLWSVCQPLEWASGTLYAFVCYRDHTFNYRALRRATMGRLAGPNRLTVPVADKAIAKVVLCVVDAEASWYLDAIELPSATVPRPRGTMHLEHRVAMLEKRLDTVVELLAAGPPRRRPDPRRPRKRANAGA
jgi:hypothetical protein